MKEGESTPITFVTTGMLLRYFVGGSLMFQDCTHIVIDEVHERSVDSDVCCYFARKLLAEMPNLRVVLMSATMQHSMYRDYFNNGSDDFGDLECLSVGVKTIYVANSSII